MSNQDPRKADEKDMRGNVPLTEVNHFVVIDKPLAEYVTKNAGVSRKLDESRVSEKEKLILDAIK